MYNLVLPVRLTNYSIQIASSRPSSVISLGKYDVVYLVAIGIIRWIDGNAVNEVILCGHMHVSQHIDEAKLFGVWEQFAKNDIQCSYFCLTGFICSSQLYRGDIPLAAWMYYTKCRGVTADARVHQMANL